MNRREEDFRVADTRQVRIDALERKVSILRDERDAARHELKQAKKLVLALERTATDAQNVAAVNKVAADVARNNLRIASDQMAIELRKLQARLAEEIAHRSIRARIRRWWNGTVRKEPA